MEVRPRLALEAKSRTFVFYHKSDGQLLKILRWERGDLIGFTF